MRAAIYDPYLDTLGGGERYCLTMATILRDLGWSVDVPWSGEDKVLKEAASRFNLNFEGIDFVVDFFKDKPSLVKWRVSSKYDFFFFLSDGSIPFLGSRVSWLHFQVPFHNVGGRSLGNQLKLKSIKRVIANSNFTKSVIDKEFAVSCDVIYPPVDTGAFRPMAKTKTILSVGRFSGLLQEKRQDILIEVFRDLVNAGLDDWSLVLAGGTRVGTESEELEELRKKTKGYPVKFVLDPSFDELVALYGKSSIFWAANGLGENPQKNPEKVEHFGIALVEAMSAGAVPLAVNLGGFPEILAGSLSSLLWGKVEQLKSETLALANSSERRKEWQEKIRRRALDFSVEKFRMAIKEALNNDLT